MVKTPDAYTPKENDLVMEDGTIIIDGKLPKVEKRVKVKIPKVPGQKIQDDVNIILNGKAIQIQKGVEVEIPQSYYEVLLHAEQMQEEADNYVIENSGVKSVPTY